MIERLEATLNKYNELETELTKPEVLSDIKKTRTYSKEMADLEDIVSCYKVIGKFLTNKIKKCTYNVFDIGGANI